LFQSLVFRQAEKKLTRQVASEKYSAAVLLSTFFACAKKVTNPPERTVRYGRGNTEPILMRNNSSVEYFLGQNRRFETELIEHFRLNVTQGGINCSCGILYAERVTPRSYDSSFCGCSSALFFAESEKNSYVKLQAKNTAPAVFAIRSRNI